MNGAPNHETPPYSPSLADGGTPVLEEPPSAPGEGIGPDRITRSAKRTKVVSIGAWSPR